MGLVLPDINGPFTGKVGSVVAYRWKGKTCVRSYRSHINYPDTEGQRQQRSWFVSMVRFASKATEALRLGLHRQAQEAQMTEGNYFIQNNKQHFRMTKSGLEVDYGKLQLTAGAAADVYFHNARFGEGETVMVDFEKNMMSLRASGEDRVYLYLYAPGLDDGYLSEPVKRRSKTLNVKLPNQWAGEEVHLYGFVVDREGRASNSTYIGLGRVNHYEEHGRYIPLNKNWNDFVEIVNEANSEPLPAAEPHTEKLEKPVIDLFSDPPEVP